MFCNDEFVLPNKCMVKHKISVAHCENSIYFETIVRLAFLTFLHNLWRFCVAIKRPDKPQISLVTNQDYLPVIMSLLTQARKSIDILSFSFTSFGAAKAIAEKLKEIKIKQQKMIQIRFFSEGIRETYERNKVTADFLSESGIEVHFGATHARGFSLMAAMCFSVRPISPINPS
jgi:hypothetical protein